MFFEPASDYRSGSYRLNHIFENNKPTFIQEIMLNNSYPSLYKKLCKDFKVASLSRSQIEVILSGLKFNNNIVKPDELYIIYFELSNTFAKIELEKLKLNYKCDRDATITLDEISERRNFILKEYECNDDEVTLSGIIATIIFIIFISGIPRAATFLMNKIKSLLSGNKSSQ